MLLSIMRVGGCGILYGLLILFACGLLGGCAPVVHDLGAAGGSGAIGGASDELRRGDNREAVKQFVASPEIQTASRTLGNGLGRGMVDEVLTDLATGNISATDVAGEQSAGAASIGRSVFPSTQATARFFREQIDPILGESVQSAVRQGLNEAMNSQSRRDAHAVAESIGEGATHGALTALRQDGMPMLEELNNGQINRSVDNLFVDHIRPALRDFFRDDIAPAISSILRESAADALKVAVRQDTAPAVMQNARNLSTGATLGSHDAAIELGLLTRDGSITPGARLLFWGVVLLGVLIGLVAAVSLVVLVMMAVSLRRDRSAMVRA